MTHKRKQSDNGGVADSVLEMAGRIIPGFQGLFKKVEQSKIFGARISEIRKEIEKRFGNVKK